MLLPTRHCETPFFFSLSAVGRSVRCHNVYIPQCCAMLHRARLLVYISIMHETAGLLIAIILLFFVFFFSCSPTFYIYFFFEWVGKQQFTDITNLLPR